MSLIEPSAENPFQQSEEEEKQQQGASKQQQPQQQRSLAESMDGVTIGVPSNGALPTLTVSQAPTTPAFLFSPAAPAAARSAAPPTDGMLTPRSLARKIAAHQSSLANADDDLFAPADGDAPAPDFPAAFGGPSFPMDDPDAPRFQSSVGQSRVKGDGLDAHTRYEIQTRWKQTLVKASEEAVAQHKAQKHAAEAADEQEAAPSSPSAAAAAQSNASPPLKIPAVSKCQRRYTDFRFLQSLLTQLYPSYLIPALPPKGLLQRFDDDFVAERRRGLQRFLSDLSALPPPLCEEFVIMQFLLYSTVDWEATMMHLQNTHGIGSVKAMGGAAWSFTSKLFNNMVRTNEDHSHDAFYAAQKESAEHHASLRDTYDYFNSKSSALLEAERNIAEQWLRFMPDFDLAASDESVKASKMAHVADTLGLDFACFLPATAHIGRVVGGSSVSAESQALVELIQHSTAMMGQIHELLKRRSVLSAAVAAAEAESRAAAQSLDTMKRRVIMGDKSAEDESRATSHATQCAAIVRDRRSELDKFHASAESQLRAYTARRRAELKHALSNFVRAQLETEARIQAHWEACLHDMDKQ